MYAVTAPPPVAYEVATPVPTKAHGARMPEPSPALLTLIAPVVGSVVNAIVPPFARVIVPRVALRLAAPF